MTNWKLIGGSSSPAGNGEAGGGLDIRGGSVTIDALPPGVAEVVGGRSRPRTGGQAPETNPLIDFNIEPVKIGDPIPVVFCRRVNGIGGVMVRPKASFVAIENTDETITTKWHCVVSEGPIGPILVKNVRRGGCRSDFQFTWNFNQRSGSWTPGNYATPQETYELPAFPTATGLGGNYARLTTIEFRQTLPYSFNWRAGYNVFIEEGLYVNRILDNVYGSSNNIVDLILWARDQTKKIPSFLNDIPSLKHAARFVNAEGLFCNGEFNNSESLMQFITGILPHFLLRPTKVNGRFSLRPLVPTRPDGTINTDTIYPDHCFTEDVIVPGSYKETSAEVSTIVPPVLSIIWRQQDSANDFPLIRSSPVADQSVTVEDLEDSPEQIDISRFCTSESHMAKVGAYIHAKRTLCRNTASVQLVPGSHTGRIREGDVVQIKINIRPSEPSEFFLNRWWEVVSISENETLTLTEFPVNQCGKSLIALAVANAPVSGVVLLPPQPAACDIPGRESDSSSPLPQIIVIPPPTITKPGGPSPGGGVDVPLPVSPPSDPPPTTPTPPAAPGGVPTGPNQPPYPAPIPNGPWRSCERGWAEITLVHSATFNSGSWGPKIDTIRSRGGVKIDYDEGVNGQILNWWYRIRYIDADSNIEQDVFLTASEDGTGGPNSANGVHRVFAATTDAECMPVDEDILLEGAVSTAFS
jgi:hypothetical protein